MIALLGVASDDVRPVVLLRVLAMTRAPFISRDDQLALVARAQQGDRKARDECIRSVLSFVYSRAKRFHRFNTLLDVDELVAEGVVGVMQAIEKFDPTFGCRFLTYAGPWIDVRIRNYLAANLSHLGGGVKARRRLTDGSFRKEKAALESRGLDPEQVDVALAKSLRTSVETIRALVSFYPSRTQSLDDTPAGHDGGSRHDVTPDSAPLAEEVLAQREWNEFLRARLSTMCLKQREQDILHLRLMPDGDPLTLAELAELFGLSRERVRQIEDLLIRRIKLVLSDLPAEAMEGRTVVKRKRAPNQWQR